MAYSHFQVSSHTSGRAVAMVGVAGLIPERYSQGYRAARDVCDVLSAAQDIEQDMLAVSIWYRHAKIAELDGMTAEQLVNAGRTNDVLCFLDSIKRRERGLA